MIFMTQNDNLYSLISYERLLSKKKYNLSNFY